MWLGGIVFYKHIFQLYITRRTINNNTPHLKSLKNQSRRAALGPPAIKLLTGGGGGEGGASLSLRSNKTRP